MKNLTLTEKQEISTAMVQYCSNYSSQTRAAESLNSVSGATISNLINQKFESISDEMFVRIASQIGFRFDKWELHESDVFQRLMFALRDAQNYKNVTWCVGDAGCGKTTAAVEYKRVNRNVYYILCSEDMRKGDFVREIAKQVGAPTDGTNLRDMLEYAIELIAYVNNPLLIFDEGDKLTDSVFNYFISIYNRLEGKCGIVFLSTDYIKKRMELGIRHNKKGYKEINSRIGRKFFDVRVTTEHDVYAICHANDLNDKIEIEKVISDAKQTGYDLRRVKRSIHASKRKLESYNAK